MIRLLGNVGSSVTEDVKETEIGLIVKKNVNKPVVISHCIENDSNDIINVRNIRKINKDFSCLTFHLGCILFLVTFNVYQYNNVHFAIHLGRVWHLGYILITIIRNVTLVTI